MNLPSEDAIQEQNEKYVWHYDAEIPGSLVSEPKHRDYRVRTQNHLEIGTDISAQVVLESKPGFQLVKNALESVWTLGDFISKGLRIGTETPRLSGQDPESSQNRNRNSNSGSPRLGIGLSLSWSGPGIGNGTEKNRTGNLCNRNSTAKPVVIHGLGKPLSS